MLGKEQLNDVSLGIFDWKTTILNLSQSAVAIIYFGKEILVMYERI